MTNPHYEQGDLRPWDCPLHGWTRVRQVDGFVGNARERYREAVFQPAADEVATAPPRNVSRGRAARVALRTIL